MHTTTTKIGSCKKRKERYRKPMNTFVPKQIDGWEKSPHSKMWLLFQIWQAWNSVVVIIIIPFPFIIQKGMKLSFLAYNWMHFQSDQFTGWPSKFWSLTKNSKDFDHCASKKLFLCWLWPTKKCKKLTKYSHGQFFNSGELLAKKF